MKWRTEWSGQMRVRDIARYFATMRPHKIRRTASAYALVRFFAELVMWETGESLPKYGEFESKVGHAAGELILAVCLWCGARGIDPQEGFEQAWKEFVAAHGDEDGD